MNYTPLEVVFKSQRDKDFIHFLLGEIVVLVLVKLVLTIL